MTTEATIWIVTVIRSWIQDDQAWRGNNYETCKFPTRKLAREWGELAVDTFTTKAVAEANARNDKRYGKNTPFEIRYYAVIQCDNRASTCAHDCQNNPTIYPTEEVQL